MSQKTTTFQSLTLFLTLLAAVSGDMTLLESTCHETDHPNLCSRCVSAPGGEPTSELGITRTVIKCIKSQGASLETEMGLIAQNATSKDAKTVFGKCANSYAMSNRDLNVTGGKLRNKEYGVVEHAVTTTLYRQAECLAEIDYYNLTSKVTTKMQFETKIYAYLTQIASRIIERLP